MKYERQDPNDAYAAVVPKWTAAMIAGDDVFINGDGETSRDFCLIDNVVQANIVAAFAVDDAATNQVYNVAVGGRTTLNDLCEAIRHALAANGVDCARAPVYRDFRAGDVRHSQAAIGKAQRLLGYVPTHTIGAGIDVAMPACNAHVPRRALRSLVPSSAATLARGSSPR